MSHGIHINDVKYYVVPSSSWNEVKYIIPFGCDRYGLGYNVYGTYKLHWVIVVVLQLIMCYWLDYVTSIVIPYAHQCNNKICLVLDSATLLLILVQDYVCISNHIITYSHTVLLRY